MRAFATLDYHAASAAAALIVYAPMFRATCSAATMPPLRCLLMLFLLDFRFD